MEKISLISVCSVIFIVLAGLCTPVSAQVELKYDDGTRGEYPFIEDQQFLRQRFDVSDFGYSGNFLVEKVSVFWSSVWAGFTVQIKLRDFDDETYEVDVATVSYGETKTINEWEEYVVPELFVSDHFYVELIWV